MNYILCLLFVFGYPYLIKSTERNCSDIECPPESPPCPKDSFRLPSILTSEGCCSLSQGCRCLPQTACPPPPKCQNSWKSKVIVQATGQPGACCPRYICASSNLDDEGTCLVGGLTYEHGAKWQEDKCTQCQCRNGLSFCEALKCPTQPHCDVVQVPTGECCPVCIGCKSPAGTVHNNFATWQEDPCTICTCENGQVRCQASMCKVTCLSPKHVEGECCPMCEDGKECPLQCEYGFEEHNDGHPICKCKSLPSTDLTNTASCLPLLECHKNCSNGYRHNRDGCPVCKCNKCKELIGCTKTCLTELESNDKGCHICKCKGEELMKTTDYNGNVENICLSSDGLKHDEGEMWSDGCHICYCHGGVEMCTIITCLVPKCKTPVLHHGECCPRCQDDNWPFNKHPNVTVCHSVDGSYHVEGETWHLSPCTHCLCHHGQVLCDTQQCPPAPCEGSQVQEGDCCPSCPLFRMTTEPEHTKISCTSGSNKENEYTEGDMWRTGPCQSCVCQHNGVNCYREKCPTVSCTRPVLRKNQCCPSCIVTEHAKSNLCVHHNNTYGNGEMWIVDKCTWCICNEGHIKCTETVCPPLPCAEPREILDQCCAICPEIHIKGNGKTTINTKIFDGVFDNKDNKVFTTTVETSDQDGIEVEKHPPSQTGITLDPLCILLISILLLFIFLLGVAVYFICLCRQRPKATYNVYHETVKDPTSNSKTSFNNYHYDKCNSNSDTDTTKRPIINASVKLSNFDSSQTHV